MTTEAVRYRAGLPRAESCIACPSTFHLVVDHCHQHGWVRGTLCGRCNSWMLWLEMGRVPDAAARSQPEVVENLTAHRLRCPDCAADITATRRPTMPEIRAADLIREGAGTVLERVEDCLVDCRGHAWQISRGRVPCVQRVGEGSAYLLPQDERELQRYEPFQRYGPLLGGPPQEGT